MTDDHEELEEAELEDVDAELLPDREEMATIQSPWETPPIIPPSLE